MPDFVHLHVHSHYSLLDGLAKIDDLVEKAKSLHMPAVALTDHGVMYGVIEFYQKAVKAGIKPIIGVEGYVARNGRFNKRARIDERPYHIVLLARNITGYKNLIKLTSRAHLEGFYYKPRMDIELIKEFSDGLIALSSCLQGEIPQAIMSGDLAKAEKIALELQSIFGPENFYLEVQHHPHVPNQENVNNKIFELAAKTNIPVVATNDVHYLNQDDDAIQDILLCLQMKKKQSDTDRMTMLGDNFSFYSSEEMESLFSGHPEVLSNTIKVAERCNVELELGKISLPHFDVPNQQSPDDYLKQLANQGLSYRYPGREKDPAVLERLEYELSVIQKTGFASYFLIVQDFVNWAKSNRIVVGPGRGSAAGSIVSYLTNITNVDPLKYDLLFERFLNPERVSMPDIDLDFADTRRDEVIHYVEEKYGKDHVAQIITFGTMAARAAIRDVGRVLGLPYSYCDKVAKLIPMHLHLQESIATVPELKEIYTTEEDGKKLLDAASKLEGVARHSSTHACGVVITKEPLDHYVPLQFAAQQDEQVVVTQYSLHPIEDLGLLKMDFLGLKNLTILENTLDIIKKARGQEINIDLLPLTDKKTFALLQKGETTGVFQLESSGMKRYLKLLKPTELEDIIAMVALYRPGPMEFIPDFIAGKHGTKEVNYLHPKLKPILQKTHGVAVYQEQLMQIARDLAGFTLSEADILRKAVGKKIKKLLDEQHDKLVLGMVKNKINKSTAEKIWKMVEPFARYGFVRAHAACYALIAYQTAYFKANHPDEFMASLLTSDYGDTDRIAIEVEECEHMGINVLPPDINESLSTFTAVFNQDTKLPEKKIRFGLSAIKNVGDNIAKVIIHERKKNGQFKNLEDFLRRVQTKDLNKKSLESLTRSGALDSFGERNQLLANTEALLNYAKSAEKAAINGQTNLFGVFPTQHAPTLRLKQVEPASKNQKLSWEKELLGLYISEHPLAEFKDHLSKIATPIADIQSLTNTQQEVKVGGIITQIQKVITRNNQPMLFVKIEDMSGRLEVLVFPTVLAAQPAIWQEDKVVLVKGKLSDKDGVIKLLCNDAKLIDVSAFKNTPAAVNPHAGNVYLNIPTSTNQTTFDQLKSIFSKYPGTYRVHIKMNTAEKPRLITTKILISEHSLKHIEVLIGVENISIEQKK
jgi:DNA polymerase III subunit alpha